MRLLVLSEHFWPRVGGTAQYVEQTCAALAARGVEIELLVPGPRPTASPTVADHVKITWIDAGYPQTGEPTRAARYRFAFCAAAEALARSRTVATRPDAVHVQFGLFLMETLDTSALRRQGVPSVVTVHNVPPMECGLSWPGAPVHKRLEDRLRRLAVKVKNRRRLTRHRYDLYVTPSETVTQMLRPLTSRASSLVTIGHGTSLDLLDRATWKEPWIQGGAGPLRLFTAGGWAPHKRQMLIPEILRLLRNDGLDAVWEIAGPDTRVPEYRAAVMREARRLRVERFMHTRGAISSSDLAACYGRAQIYVQPSTEEGFCMTALDAAAAGLPVVACPTGALPEITALSGGTCVKSTPGALAAAVARVSSSEPRRQRRPDLLRRCCWDTAASTLERHIRGLVRMPPVSCADRIPPILEAPQIP